MMEGRDEKGEHDVRYNMMIKLGNGRRMGQDADTGFLDYSGSWQLRWNEYSREKC